MWGKENHTNVASTEGMWKGPKKKVNRILYGKIANTILKYTTSLRRESTVEKEAVVFLH